MSISPPALPPLVPPALQVGSIAAVGSTALLAGSAGSPSLPFSQPVAGDPVPDAAALAPEAAPDGGAMRPDQAVLARQLAYPAQDASTLARNWHAQVRSQGSQLAGRAIAASAGQLSPAQLAAAQQGQVLRAPEQALPHPDAWRFTVHTGGHQAHHLAVLSRDADQPPGRRRRPRAALRLELELADGSTVVAQVESLPQGVAIELCAADARGLAQLREVQPELERILARAGVTVLRWQFSDRLPVGSSHAMLANAEAAAQALTLDVFRAVTELALRLPADPRQDLPAAG